MSPQGAPLDNIIESGLLDDDKHRADSYVKVKKLIDEHHKAFIDMGLSDECLKYDSEGKEDSLTEYYEAYLLKGNNDGTKENLITFSRLFGNRLPVN